MDRGRVYWITGLSNSGKTTIGTALYYRIKKKKNDVVILDGDLMKEIASGTDNAKFEDNDRRIRAKRYSQMAKLLSDQGIWVIVCAIAMYDEVREWNRKNVKGYIEIFLNTPYEVLKRRDKKGLFNENRTYEFPKNPDLVFLNDGLESVKNIVDRIVEIEPKSLEDYDRDRQYWNSYYQSIKNQKIIPSNFAQYVEKLIKKESHVLELGCGNGRDSLYFMSKGHNVIAIDGSDTAIEHLNEFTKDNKNVLFVCDNFVKCRALYQMRYDCIYSRFTLHAITEEQENELLANIKEALDEEGILCIEARTIHDDIYGKGREVEHNAFFYNGHYRRFIDIEEFKIKLQNMGYEIVSIEESKGFSKTDTSDPYLMRCIAKI